MRAAPTQEDIRRQNLGALLRRVHILGPVSRAQLTAGMGLNRSTIGALTTDLTEAGLVLEEQPRDPGGGRGRPSLVVRARSQRVYVLAFGVGVDRLVAARVGLGGAILDRREIQRPGGPFGVDETLERLAEFAAALSEAAAPEARCVGAAAAVPAMVARDGGELRYGPNIGWRAEPFGARLSAAAGREVVIGNDGDLGALGEHTRGAAVGYDDAVYIHGDVGIGGGIIAGGRPLTGADGCAAEIGHMVVNPDGRPCPCGSYGCWETEIGEAALLRGPGRGGTLGRDAVHAAVDAASRGDKDAEETLRTVGDWLGIGVANLVNLLNPRIVVFGGTLRIVYPATAAQVRSRINRTALATHREHLRLRTAVLGDDAPLHGAAELAFTGLFDNPLEFTSS
ncbi:ROK family protein [Yinghuangia seranimata]|uniref:ROK family protein n=1 Tax=Yinghuangia seranimata TaxID=408067 RepID=UPI00248BF322|nr:ROK family protein [Yinghuangia seranimata]MDI2130435.1 ROK family protein [Yinghuangia seranimata]